MWDSHGQLKSILQERMGDRTCSFQLVDGLTFPKESCTGHTSENLRPCFIHFLRSDQISQLTIFIPEMCCFASSNIFSWHFLLGPLGTISFEGDAKSLKSLKKSLKICAVECWNQPCKSFSENAVSPKKFFYFELPALTLSSWSAPPLSCLSPLPSFLLEPRKVCKYLHEANPLDSLTQISPEGNEWRYRILYVVAQMVGRVPLE